MICFDISDDFMLFCDTVVYTGEVTSSSYDKRPQFKRGEEFFADVQPYSSQLLHKEYGIDGECGLRMFSPPTPPLTVGDYLLIGDKVWRIRELFGWRSGVCTILEEAREYDYQGV